MRQLLVKEAKQLTTSLSGNCTVLDDGTEHKIETIDSCGDDVLIELYNGWEKDTVRDMIAEEEFKKFCIAYMSGYVVQKIEKLVKCGDCVLASRNNENDALNCDIVRNLSRRQNTQNKLITYPSNSVYQLILIAERIFEHEINWQCSLPKTVNLIHYLTMKTIRIIDVVKLFPGLNDHLLNQSPTCDENHVMSITKLVIGRYFKVRCLSYVKLINQRHNPETSKRNELLKLLHVKGM